MKIAIGTGIAFIVCVFGILLAIVFTVPPCKGFHYPVDVFQPMKVCE